MTELFATADYREFLNDLVYSPHVKRGYQAQLAKAIGCQAAYLSQVLKAKAELTEDHAFKLARFLELSPVATEYLTILVRQSRASTSDLRQYLEQRRLQILLEQEEIRSRVKHHAVQADESTLFEYFSSPLPSLVHIATSSKNYRTIDALAARFRTSPSRIREVISFLDRVDLVERKENGWQFKGGPLHFPRESLVNSAHQQGRRQQAMRSIEDSNFEDTHFSSVFTLDAKTYREVKASLLDFIEKSHQTIQTGGTDEVYTMCLDLFRSV